MYRLIDLVRTNKSGEFWEEDPSGLILKDLQFINSGLFSLDYRNTTLNLLGKFSLSSGSKLVYERIDNVRQV